MMRLGRKPRHPRAHVARLSRALTRRLPAGPETWDGTAGCSFPMLDNDRLSNCTIAGLAHQLHMQAVHEGRPLQFTPKDVDDFYFNMSGGADEGLVELDVLSRVRERGFPLSGACKLAGWAYIDPVDRDDVRAACAEFVGIYAGAALPLSAQSQDVWDASSGPHMGDEAPGSWGGHCMVVGGYDPEGVEFLTWGMKRRATWAWWDAYVDEAYALLDLDRALAAGVDMARLAADMASLALAATGS